MLRAHDRPDPVLDRPAVEHVAESPDGAAGPDDSLAFLAPPRKPGSLGRLGDYEVLEVVGRGGMGVVFRAFDDKLQRVVAIKVLASRLAAIKSARQGFLREARAAGALADDNVVAIHAVEDAGPVPYMVMQFIGGGSLQEKLDRTGALPLHETLRIGWQIAEGLAAAHQQGVVHCDVKPANILMGTRRRGSSSRISAWCGPGTTRARRCRTSWRARPCTCRRNKPRGRRSAAVRTCSVWAACSTRCVPASHPSALHHRGRAGAGLRGSGDADP